MTCRLLRRTIVPGELSHVFAFFKNPRNREAITLSWLGFRIVSRSDDSVREGTRIRYRLRIAGIPMAWESRITEYGDSSHFADEQFTGPYQRWYHRHTFRAVPGGVEMMDDLEYALPFGPIGRVVHWLVVRHQQRAIFDHRTNVITERFGAIASAATTPGEPVEQRA